MRRFLPNNPKQQSFRSGNVLPFPGAERAILSTMPPARRDALRFLSEPAAERMALRKMILIQWQRRDYAHGTAEFDIAQRNLDRLVAQLASLADNPAGRIPGVEA